MKKNDIIHQINLFKKLLIVKSPDILTVAGVIGFCGSLVYGIKVTPEAVKLIESAEKEKGEELTKIETVKVVTSVCFTCGDIKQIRSVSYGPWHCPKN